MLYAATREATKSAFGGSATFAHEMHCGSKEEATHAAYLSDVLASTAPAPKTEEEVVKEELKKLEIAESSSCSGCGSAGTNVAFPLSPQAAAALADVQGGRGPWVMLFKVCPCCFGF
jgi:hypothetical protein